MLNALVRYFDLQSGRRLGAVGHAADSGHAPVLPQYFIVALGVVVDPLLRHYIQYSSWNVAWSTLFGRVVFGLIVGIIILPAVYKSTFDTNKPIFLQLLALFPLGIGWQSLFTAATQGHGS